MGAAAVAVTAAESRGRRRSVTVGWATASGGTTGAAGRGGSGTIQRSVDGQRARLTKRFEIVPARLDERMVWRKSRGHDLVRPPVAPLRFRVISNPLADDAEVVERAGDVGVRRTELALLKRERVMKMSRRRVEITRRRRLFGGINGRSDLSRIRHDGIPAGESYKRTSD